MDFQEHIHIHITYIYTRIPPLSTKICTYNILQLHMDFQEYIHYKYVYTYHSLVHKDLKLEDFVTWYVYCVLQRYLLIWSKRGGGWVIRVYLYVLVCTVRYVRTLYMYIFIYIRFVTWYVYCVLQCHLLI